MTNRGNRVETWLARLAGAVGVGLVAIYALNAYMTSTPPLHAEPERVPSVRRAEPPPAWADAVARAQRAARQALVERSLPGLSAAVGLDGSLVWAEGFGWADLDRQVLVEPETRFRIGTASTVLTSAAVGVLMEQGRLNLDGWIQTHVPAFPEKAWPVSLRQVMGHTGGIGTDGGDEGPLFTTHCARPIDALPAFADRALLFEPGTRYRYSRYGWILVSAAVEAAAEAPFLTFMRKEVFEPIGMDDTAPDSATEPVAERATPYFPRYGSDPRYGLHPTRPLDYSCYAGAGVFVSTPSDLVRFGLAMHHGTLLRPATVDLLQTPQRLPSGEETGYGLGWDLETVTLAGRPARAAGHDGDSLGGMVASLMTFRDRGLVVAVASNISYADTASIALAIAEAFAAPSGTSERPSP